MIRTHSDDPDVETAAVDAAAIVKQILGDLAPAKIFDYGGHILTIGEYEVCSRCTVPIAEAQQAHQKLLERASETSDSVVKEHLELVAELFRLEAAAAEIRAELHNGHGSEQILNTTLGFMYDRNIHDDYNHSHKQGN